MSTNKTVLITGTTGAIGSMHLLELLKRGYEVICLIRGNDKGGRFEKLSAVVGEDIASQVRIISGEITQDLAGVNLSVIKSLKGKIDVIIHHAGSIVFDQERWEEIMATNVGGTRNMLALTEALEAPQFCYDSTAYALNIPPHNPYEEGKQEAEVLVNAWDKGDTMIWRPSIVVGRMTDGMSKRFNGYYGFFSAFSHLKYQLFQRWQESQDRSRSQGFEFDGDGNLVLHHHLFIDYSLESTLNLVPVDWVVKSMTDLMEQAQWGRSYNLCDPNPKPIAWIFDRTFEFLGIKGVENNSKRPKIAMASTETILSNWQRGLDERLLRYRCYVMDEKQFTCDAIGNPPPTVDVNFLRTMLDFAVKENFGRRKEGIR